MNKKGILVTFEGIDKCGKSTQIEMLRKRIYKEGYRVKNFYSLNDSFNCIPKLLLSPSIDMDYKTELLLYMVDRCRMTRKIKNALNKNFVVLVDRYIDSSIIYQGLVRRFDIDFIEYLNNFVTDGLRPDLTLILGITKEDYIKRISLEKKDRLEIDVEKHYETIMKGYTELALKENRFKIIKENSIKKMSEDIFTHVKKVITNELDN